MVRRGCTAEKIAARLKIIEANPALQQFQAHSESEFAAIISPLITKVGGILVNRIVSVVVALFCVACFFSSHVCMQAYIGTTWRVDAGKLYEIARWAASVQQHCRPAITRKDGGKITRWADLQELGFVVSCCIFLLTHAPLTFIRSRSCTPAVLPSTSGFPRRVSTVRSSLTFTDCGATTVQARTIFPTHH